MNGWMNHDNTHCYDFSVDCPMTCFRAELEVDLRNRWVEFIGVPLSYSHLYGTCECKRAGYTLAQKDINRHG